MTTRQSTTIDLLVFFALACALTWALGLPLALAWTRHEPPSPLAMGLVGLGAWGPTIAAVVVAARRRAVRGVFGPWRTSVIWIVIAFLAPFALHLPATLAEVALGGEPAQWFYPPARPEHWAALVMFSIGEEFGWRGFAYPRVVERWGPIVGPLVLGAVWGLWHLVMMVKPDGRTPAPVDVAIVMATLALWSVVIAWLLEKSNRSLAVAIAVHMGAHIDNVDRAPETELRLRVLRFVVVAIAAALAARSLLKSPRAPATLAPA